VNAIQCNESDGTKTLIYTVLVCHFLTSFTALGMPIFLPRITADLLAPNQQHWIGWFYSLPLVCMAISAPLWGWFADAFGKRLSLMRAQLGLTIGFLITGFSDSVILFSVGIILQGLCGGTFAASNAYLASQVKSSQLSSTMNWMQVSARASLLVAPIILGLFMNMAQPRRIFLYLALLPLAAFIITCWQKKDKPGDKKSNKTAEPIKTVAYTLPRSIVSIIQFCFFFATVVTFPYFLPWANQLGIESEATVGLLFSLPHLCYLILMVMKIPKIKSMDALSLCQISFLGFMIASLQQAFMTNADWLIVWRLLTGLALFFGFLGLHKLIADLTTADNAGRMFGWFDSIGKWSAVIAGLVSGFAITEFGLSGSFYMSSLVIMIAWCIVSYTQIKLRMASKTHIAIQPTEQS